MGRRFMSVQYSRTLCWFCDVMWGGLSQSMWVYGLLTRLQKSGEQQLLQHGCMRFTTMILLLHGSPLLNSADPSCRRLSSSQNLFNFLSLFFKRSRWHIWSTFSQSLAFRIGHLSCEKTTRFCMQWFLRVIEHLATPCTVPGSAQ